MVSTKGNHPLRTHHTNFFFFFERQNILYLYIKSQQAAGKLTTRKTRKTQTTKGLRR
ncbi:hypothetical protein Hanom_Chr01g00050711 [Helianthus anomalus]